MRIDQLRAGARQAGTEFGDRGEAAVLASQNSQTAGIARDLRARQLALNLIEPRERLREQVAETQLSLPYFWRNRSTRPAVSTNFCLPV
jgi:hypothetical protein